MSALALVLLHDLRGLLGIWPLLVKALPQVTIVILALMKAIRTLLTPQISRHHLNVAWT